MQNRQPKICPLTNYEGFPGHGSECPHSQNYIKECVSFSKWFWYKVAQFQVEPVTEEKVPQEIVRKIYGKGWNDALKSGGGSVAKPYCGTIYHKVISDEQSKCGTCGKNIPVGEAYYLDGFIATSKTCEECHGEWDDDPNRRYGVAELSMSTPRALQLLENIVLPYFKSQPYEQAVEAQAMLDFMIKHLSENHLLKKRSVFGKSTS